MLSPQPVMPPAVLISTITRVTPVRTPEPHTMGFLSGTFTIQCRAEVIVRSLALAADAGIAAAGAVA